MNVYQISTSVPESFRDRLDRYAEREGLTRAKAILHLLTAGLEHDAADKTVTTTQSD